MRRWLEDKYWQQIEELEWSKDGDYKRIKQQLIDNFTPSEIKQLDVFVHSKVNELSQRFHDDWLGDPGIDVSDDGWSDLTNEVVGRGKEFYENITVAKLQEMADNNDYNESFSYCFHITFYNEKSEEEKRTQFQLNKPKRIEEFISKIDGLYDEYHAELYQSGVFHYLEGAIREARKLK